jgi:hypothetical protein
MRSDLRGFVFGLSLGLAALAGFGAANLQAHAPRFQISAAGTSDGFRCYIVDTQAGTLWVKDSRGDAFERLGNLAIDEK